MSTLLSSEDIQARILFRDAQLLILNKPPGLPVHAGSGGGATLEASFDALRFELPHHPALAHRLDRDTSGCLVLGRTRESLKRLGHLFQSGRVEKLYWAIVEGAPKELEGRIALPLKKRDAASGSWRMMTADDGAEAVTEYRVLGQDGRHSWLALAPRTGRTHQIRVHCAALGCPVLGDWIYGHAQSPRRPEGVALCLHARAVSIPYYGKAAPIAVEAPAPPHMHKLLRRLGFQPDLSI